MFASKSTTDFLEGLFASITVAMGDTLHTCPAHYFCVFVALFYVLIKNIQETDNVYN